MKLEDQIEHWRRRMAEAHDQEKELIEELSTAMYDYDAKIRGQIEQLTLEADARRADIVRSLEGLAARIGHYPAPQQAQTMPPPIPPTRARVPNPNRAQQVAYDLDDILNGHAHN